MVRSSFFEYGVAASALFSAQANLQIHGHNVSNAAIDGYSRQYGVQRATTPMAGYGQGMYGTGSEVYAVRQHRSSYLDNRFWTQNAVLGEYETKATQLQTLTATFNDMGDTGLNALQQEFFEALSELSLNPGDLTVRNNSVVSSVTLIESINALGTSMIQQQKDINSEVKTVTDTVNSLGRQIASLNEQIRRSEIDGSSANDLRDQRGVLIDELSKIVNVEAREIVQNEDYNPLNNSGGPNKKSFVILIDGQEFVKGEEVSVLNCIPRKKDEKKNEMDADGLYDIVFSSSGKKINMYSSSMEGSLKGLIELRDGNNGVSTKTDAGGNPIQTSLFKGLPHYMNRLNELVRTFSMGYNQGEHFRDGTPIKDVAGHVGGFDKNGNKGQLYFTYKDMNGTYINPSPATNMTSADYMGFNFLNIEVNPDIKKDPNLVAAASTLPSDESDGNNILGLIKISSDNTLFKQGKLEDYIVGMASELGVNTKQGLQFAKNYSDIVVKVNIQRMSISGVNLDEEQIEINKNTMLYQAAANLINSIDIVYDTLINKLGV